MNRLKETILLFLKLGFTAFGGPAAHIAIMEDEIVAKRKWMDRQHFLDLMGATNLIPGPNSTEMAIHCGYHRAGIAGFLAAGICFILPAVLITAVIAYFYVKYGTLPEAEPFLYGIKPAVIVIILNAVFKLGLKAAKGIKLILTGAAAAVLNLAGTNEILSILCGGIAGTLFIFFSEKIKTLNVLSPAVFLIYPVLNLFTDPDKTVVSLTKLFLSFLKIGAVLFGSGYVLVSYLDGEFVQNLNWINRHQLMDAVAIGQLTPGPILSAATFIGYQVAGTAGALTATFAIFLPSFIFVFIINPFIPKLRQSKVFSVFLDAVNISALAVMLVTALKLGAEVLVDWQNIVIAAISIAAFFLIKKISSAFIILGGAAAGYLLYFLF